MVSNLVSSLYILQSYKSLNFQDVAVKILMEQDFHAERFKEFLREVSVGQLSCRWIILKVEKYCWTEIFICIYVYLYSYSSIIVNSVFSICVY